MENDGKSIPTIVDMDTLSYYQRLINDSATISKNELDSRNILAKLIIIRLRHDYPKRELERLTAEELLTAAIDKGLISQASVSNIQNLVNIKISVDIAVASTQTQPDFPAFHFIKQEGAWKLSLWKSFGQGVTALNMYKEKLKKDDYELIEFLHEQVSHKEFNDKTLSGPLE